MTYQRKALGKSGEELAQKFLQDKGYLFLGKNLKLKFGEIDLLMRDKNTLVICEVKTKSSSRFGLPQEEVDYFKKKKLIKLAKALWQKNPKFNIRIDVVAVDESNNKIDHIINAVEEK